jgi:predicted lipoprotein with Yx(FWY)xxD motif
MHQSIHSLRIRALATVSLLAIAVAACSSSGASPAASSAPTSAPSAVAAGGGQTITVAVASGDVGSYLTGAGGKTLYVFTPDSANTSTCVDTCAATWPPFTVGASDTLTPGAGVTGALTTFARPDGALQVAINGLPLYYFAADAKAGDTSGQGIGGKWFVGPPDGVIPAAAPSTGSSY